MIMLAHRWTEEKKMSEGAVEFRGHDAHSVLDLTKYFLTGALPSKV